jgi:uncharacterized membrane protein YidH (DUF202 family)
VPALVVLGLLAVVAIAATGSTERGDDRTRPPAATLLDTILSLGLVAVVAGGLLLLYGLMQRQDVGREMRSGRYPRSSLAGWILFVFAFTAFVYWRGDWKLRPMDSSVGDVLPTERVPPPSGSPPDATGTTYEPRLAWIPILVVLGLVATAVAAHVISERRSRHRVSEREALREEIAGALDETLDDLRTESDPRRAVIAAYARLERIVAATGLPRRQAETQEEYLVRFLASLNVSETAARRLTDLFERAKFSQHAVDVDMKEEAIGALEQLRDELRRAREARDEATRAELEPGGAAS